LFWETLEKIPPAPLKKGDIYFFAPLFKGGAAGGGISGRCDHPQIFLNRIPAEDRLSILRTIGKERDIHGVGLDLTWG
jgi:hypothetical protein